MKTRIKEIQLRNSSYYVPQASSWYMPWVTIPHGRVTSRLDEAQKLIDDFLYKTKIIYHKYP